MAPNKCHVLFESTLNKNSGVVLISISWVGIEFCFGERF